MLYDLLGSTIIFNNTDFRIQQMIYIRAEIIPESILITPATQPADLADLLSQKGFTIDNSSSCMLMKIEWFWQLNYYELSADSIWIVTN